MVVLIFFTKGYTEYLEKAKAHKEIGSCSGRAMEDAASVRRLKGESGSSINNEIDRHSCC